MNLLILALATIIASTPASVSGGRTMSPSESQSPVLRPESRAFRWIDRNSFKYKSHGRWYIEELSGRRDSSSTEPGVSVDTTGLKIRGWSGNGKVYGESVSRNEFGIDGGIFHGNTGRLTAFYMKDESAVTDFPLLDISTRTGKLESIKYPMNGMASEKVAAGIYDNTTGAVILLDVNDFTDERYITNLSWNPDDTRIYAQIADREQHNVHLNAYNSSDGSFAGTILTEHNDAWVEPYEPLHFITKDLFIYSTDNRDGYKNLYLCDTHGGIRRLTCTDADTRYSGILLRKVTLGGGRASIFYTTAEFSPIENHLMRMDVSWTGDRVSGVKFNKTVRLTKEEGWHDIVMSPDGSHYTDKWSSFDFPGAARLCNADGKTVRMLYSAKDPLSGYETGEMEYGTVKAADGSADNYFRFLKPAGFDPGRKYPLVVYVYGGPHSQMVQNKWRGNIRMWEMAMAQRGYAVYVQDNRGTSNRGAAFEKAINRKCGKSEMEDQMAGLEELLKRCPWIDRDRIGVHGWSYGGFMTISLAVNYPEYFKVAVAGGPVIDWKWYEVMYGERYMDTEETNPEGFAATSLIGRAGDLKAKLLICQGAVDRTVVWQHSLNFIQSCIERGIPVDYFPYPISEHNMTGPSRLHLYEKITGYFLGNL